MVPVLLVTAAIAIVAGGFLSYKLFFSPAGVRVPVKVTAPKAVQQKEPPVLPSVAQQPKEQPAAEVKPAETKEAPQKAPQQTLPQALTSSAKSACCCSCGKACRGTILFRAIGGL